MVTGARGAASTGAKPAAAASARTAAPAEPATAQKTGERIVLTWESSEDRVFFTVHRMQVAAAMSGLQTGVQQYAYNCGAHSPSSNCARETMQITHLLTHVQNLINGQVLQVPSASRLPIKVPRAHRRPQPTRPLQRSPGQREEMPAKL